MQSIKKALTGQFNTMNDLKSIYFKVPKIETEGFVVQYDELEHFYNRLHHHPEIQLIYIIKGTGNFFVNDSITPFESGNLFLIGPNQSHIFKSDPDYFKEDFNKHCCSVSIFFKEDSLGKGFFDMKETIDIRKLINKSNRCIKFEPEIAHFLGKRMKDLLNIAGFERFLEVLSILNELSQSDEYTFLTTATHSQPLTDEESERINNVVNYILNNYSEDITLKNIAKVANYSKPAFCRFFKQRTRKTFSTFLNEVRVAQACKLLRNSNQDICQICYESGYNNVSNFNRQFKRLTGFSPSDYKHKCKDMTAYHQLAN